MNEFINKVLQLLLDITLLFGYIILRGFLLLVLWSAIAHFFPIIPEITFWEAVLINIFSDGLYFILRKL